MPTEFTMQQNKKTYGVPYICIMYVGCGCVRFTLLTHPRIQVQVPNNKNTMPWMSEKSSKDNEVSTRKRNQCVINLF